MTLEVVKILQIEYITRRNLDIWYAVYKVFNFYMSSKSRILLIDSTNNQMEVSLTNMKMSLAGSSV